MSQYETDIKTWQASRVAALQTDNSWLTVAGLFWLDEGDNAVGSDPQCNVLLPEGKAPGRVGVITLHQQNVTFRAEPGVTVLCQNAPVSQIDLHVAAAPQKDPLILTFGTLSFFVILRRGRVAIRLRDSASAARAAFKGLEYFPIDPSWRITGSFETYNPPKPIMVPNVIGTVEEELSPGAVVFEKDGQTFRLDVAAGQHSTLFMIFADKTNGQESYGSGRFINAEMPKDGKVVIDFNQAYNPPCAFTEHATCPLPPAQNRLPLRVTAGEKKMAKK